MTARRGTVSPRRGASRAAGHGAPVARRAGAWLVWWAILMALWVILDYSRRTDELLAGAGAAALGASLAEVACAQAGVRLHPRARWLLPALRLPGEVVRDTLLVFGALARQVCRGTQPPSGFREVPVRYGGEGPADTTRRVLLVGARSLAPNTFVAGIDKDREVMVIHQLVVNQGREVPR